MSPCIRFFLCSCPHFYSPIFMFRCVSIYMCVLVFAMQILWMDFKYFYSSFPSPPPFSMSLSAFKHFTFTCKKNLLLYFSFHLYSKKNTQQYTYTFLNVYAHTYIHIHIKCDTRKHIYHKSQRRSLLRYMPLGFLI